MKKVVFVLFLFVVFFVSAQDTLSRPPDYCAVHYWLGDTLPLSEYDFRYRMPAGARPVKRVIQREVLNPLSQEMLEGKISAKDNIVIDAVDNQLIFYNPERGK